MRTIVVRDYDPIWPAIFEQLRLKLWAVVDDFAVSTEHVGSTAVPGLEAKPIIDMDIVVSSGRDVAAAIDRLSTLGYVHRGNLGVEGRVAFRFPPGSWAHHLYVCREGSLGLRNHLAVRDYLRANPQVALAYGELKRKLADEYPDDIDRYMDGKTEFLLQVLRNSGFTPGEVKQVATVNQTS